MRRTSEAINLQTDIRSVISELKSKPDLFPPLEGQLAPFDDSEIDTSTIEGHGKINGGIAIDTARRGSGRWACRYAARIGERLLDQDWTGDHPTREAALVFALDAVDDFLPKTARGCSRADFVQARAIRRGLHEIDLAFKAATGKTVDQIRGLA